jgi:hypothetical protein
MGKSGSSSQANQSTQTTNVDKRVVAEGSLIATEGASIYNSSYSLDPVIVSKALDTVAVIDAQNGDGFSKLLNLAGNLFDTANKNSMAVVDQSTSLASRFQDNVMDAYSRGTADKAGAIDQKTMIVLGVTAAAAVAFIANKGK